jgi:D-alanyl-D-alanine carboxypeptidase
MGHMHGYNRNMTIKKIGVIAIVLAALLCGGLALTHHHKTTANSKQTGASASSHGFNRQQYSLTDPASLWLVVNKIRPLNPKDYAPADLVVPNVPLRLNSNQEEMHVRAQTAKAMESMVNDAGKQGIKLMLASGYRSYNFQVNLYNGYVKQQGQAEADKQSARPGYSEHQTGLAADLEPASRTCEVEQCFAATPEGKWLAANAYKYGFVIRYADGKDKTTGYEYEPWHVRYVGTSLATEMHKQHVSTLEEFFGLPAAPDYK